MGGWRFGQHLAQTNYNLGLRLLEVKSVHLFQKLILHFYDRDFTLCITHSFDYMTMHLSTMHLVTMTMHLFDDAPL